MRPSDLPPVRYRGRVFIRIGPRRDIATEADLSKGTNQGTSHTDKTIEEKIIEFCKEPRTLAEIMGYLGYKDKTKFKRKYINPLLNNRLAMSVPEKPNSRSQKYFAQSE